MTKIFQELDTIEKRVFWALCLVIISSLFMYGYFVNSTVVNIVERKNFNTEFEALSSTFSSLESEYLALTSQIDIAFARSLGFSETKNVKFVTKTGLAFVPANVDSR